jgi:hypothetical protein
MITLTPLLSGRDAPSFLDVIEKVLRHLTTAYSPSHKIYAVNHPLPIIEGPSSLFNVLLFIIRLKIFLKHNHKAIKRQVTAHFLSKDMIIRLTYHMCSICTKRSSASLSTSPQNISVTPPNAILSSFNMLVLYMAVFGSATVLAGHVTGDWKAASCEYLVSRKSELLENV